MDEEGDIAEGPNGQRLIYQGGRWVPLAPPSAGPRIGAPLTPPRPRLPTPQTPEQAEKDRLDVEAGRAKPGNTRFDQASKLRDDYERSPAVRNYNTFLGAYIPSLQNSGTPGSDLQLIYAYAKVMDPDSAVREGEAASIAGGDSIFNQTVARLGRELGSNGQFTPEYRKQLLLEMNQRGVVMRNAYNTERDRYAALAERNNIPAPDVIGPDRGSNTRYAKLEDNFWNQGNTRMNDAPGEVREFNTSIAGAALGLDPSAEPPTPELTGGRLSPAGEARYNDALRNGDFGQAIAVLEKEFGKQDDRSRQSVRAVIDYLKANPNAPIPPTDYTRIDQTEQQKRDRERYGDYLDQAVEERKGANRADVFVRGAANTGSAGIANYLEAGLDAALTDRTFDQALQRQRAIDEADYRNNPGTQIAGSVTGALASPLGRSRSVGGAVLNNALVGAADQALDSTSAEEAVGRGTFGALAGGLGGGLGATVGRGGFRAAERGMSSPEWAPLYAQGIKPTPGQRAGGPLNTFEEALTSVPIMGGLVRGARQGARDDFEMGAFNQALGEIGQSLPSGTKLGTKPHQFAQRAFNAAYDDARSGMRLVRDADFDNDIAAIVSSVNGGALDEAAAKRFAAILDSQIGRRMANGIMDGETYKKATSGLGKLAEGARKSQNFELADVLDQAAGALDRAARRHSDPVSVQKLDAADRGYAQLVRIEDAASRAGGDAGRFSPAQFERAVQKAEGGVRSKPFLRGDALMEGYATAGKKLADRLPNSGTADRVMAGQVVGGGALGGLSTVSPFAAMTTAAATLPYGLHRSVTGGLMTPQFYGSNAAKAGSGLGKLARVFGVNEAEALEEDRSDSMIRKLMRAY